MFPAAHPDPAQKSAAVVGAVAIDDFAADALEESISAHPPGVAISRRTIRSRFAIGWCAALLALLATLTVSLMVGRYPVGFGATMGMVFGHIPFIDTSYTSAEQAVLLHIRLPRILSGLLVGVGLAAAGAGYQTMFRNPLVSPDILGVSAGAGFGGALAVLLHLPYWQLETMAFGGGLIAATVSLGIARSIGQDSPILLVLTGVVVASVFAALISMTEYLANPDDTLPAITFWLMGGLGRQQLDALVAPTVIMAASLMALYAVRWPVTVLATGDEDAHTLGVNTRHIWITVVVACTLTTATTVSLAGIVGWVGLLVPHLARAIVGPGFGGLLIASAVLGSAFVVGVDDITRTATAAEVPLGILTALIGAPFFLLVLAKMRRQWA
jgi:iron complex transport system permease protein